MQLCNKMIEWFMMKYLKASENSTFQLTLSGADLDCSFRTMILTPCTVCNVTLFWHHLDILLSSSTHQIRHIYLVKCLIMFLQPKRIYYLVAPRLWSLMLFKKNGTPITLKESGLGQASLSGARRDTVISISSVTNKKL